MLGPKKYTSKFSVDLSRLADEDYQYVRLAYGGTSGAKKVLFVLDYMPSEDLESGKLLSGSTGDLLENVLKTSLAKFGKQNEKFEWLAVTFNAFRTAGKSRDFVETANEAFTDRIQRLALAYKPDLIIAFGKNVFKNMMPDYVMKSKGKLIPWLGRPLDLKLKSKEKTHKCKFVFTLSLDFCINKGAEAASLLGLVCRNVSYLFGTEYKVDTEALSNRSSIYVDDLSGFKKMMKRLVTQKDPVAIDTETRNLTKVCNKLLTAQFAPDPETGFFLPFYHKDSPFSPKELNYMKTALRDYFEGNNNNDYHIYANATFDLPVLYEDLGFEYYGNDIWDVFGGEFALDENLKNTSGKACELGEWYYSLLNVSAQYGIDEYFDAQFGKDNRANFENVKLDKHVVRYGTLDVCGPYALHLQQKKRAARMKYKKYEAVVRYEISDTIHSFSRMEHSGNLIDVPFLFFLNSDQSPIKQIIKEKEEALLNCEAAKKANARLAKSKGVALQDMWGKASQLLDITKPAALKMLFFDVMGLKPLSVGTNGKPKMDKKFQKEYAGVPEVAMYTELQQSKKLRDAFVKSFIKKLKTSLDVQKDKKIRSSYSYIKVATHRTSANDPNLQQIPSRSKLGKLIKRLFIAPLGHLYIKVDYQVHEVRGWGIISKDAEVAKTFAHGKALRDEYKLNPTPELAERIKLEGDVHKINAAFFFKKKISEIDKAIRDSVKAVVFGLIYGKGKKALAEDIKDTEEKAQELLDMFFKRFPKAVGWTRRIKEFAKENLYVEAFTGIRRNLWAYLVPSSHMDARSMWGKMDRQAGNAPIQGMCSKFMMNGIRLINTYVYKLSKARGSFSLKTINSVHDSLEAICSYKDFMKSLALIEWALTDGVAEVVRKRHGEQMVSTPAIDMDIGSSLSNCETWDTSVEQLYLHVKAALEHQRDELKYDVNVASTLKLIFAQVDDMPKWLRQQIKNLNWKLPEYVDGSKIADQVGRTTPEKLIKVVKSKLEDESFDYLNEFLHSYPIGKLDMETIDSLDRLIGKARKRAQKAYTFGYQNLISSREKLLEAEAKKKAEKVKAKDGKAKTKA